MSTCACLLLPLLILKFRRRDALDDVRFYLIADFHVVEVLEADTAFKTFTNFRHVVFESAQRSDVTFPCDDCISNQARARITTNRAINDHASRNSSSLRHAEHFANVGLAEYFLFLDCFEHADHGRADLFLNLVDD